MSERLAELLREAADAPEPLQLQDIEQRVRRNHRRRIALAATVVTAAVAAVVVPVTVLPDHRGQAALTATPPPTPVANVVTYHHVTVLIPAGWHVAYGALLCEPRGETIEVNPDFSGDCPPQPFAATHQTAIVLEAASPVLPAVPRASVSARWAGQLVIASQSVVGSSVSDHVALPLMQLQISVTAPTAAAADALLAGISAHPVAGLDIPLTATKLTATEGPDGIAVTSQPALLSVTDPAAIATLLEDLRELPTVPAETPLCSNSLIKLLTLTPTLSIYIYLGTAPGHCKQVVSDTGARSLLTPQLSRDLGAALAAAHALKP